MLDKIDNLDLGLDARNKINLAFDTIDALMLASASSSGYSSIEDEGTPLTNRSTLNFVGAGVSVADSGSKTVVTITTPSVAYSENITYAALLNLFNTSALEVGKQYILTDFATKHVIPNSGGTVNTGSTESLVVLATAVNKLDFRVKSITYPKDVIYYELIDSSTAGGDKGRIFYRKDTNINISTYYDWRNVKFRRFRNAQTINLVVGGSSLNVLGRKVTGSISGAVGYVIGGTGANILRVVNHTGIFQAGEIITLFGSGTTRTTSSVADYSVDADTYVSNGRSSTDVYTFIDSSATGMYNINIGKVSSTGPSDLLNNITFSSGSHDVSMDDDSYNLSMSACINFHTKGIFSNNYFRGGVSDMTFVSGGSSNFFYSASYGNSIFPIFSNNIIAGLFSYNKIIGYSFGLNDIAYDFQFNTIDIRFSSNVVETNSVRYNNIQADVQSKTFLYTATAITQFWTKRIINGSDANIYLEYFDGLLLTYVDPLVT